MLLTSSRTLAQYMKFRQVSVRQLADRVGCSRSTIGHLRSGHRKGCKPEVAVAIERILETPPGLLFVPEVERGAPSTLRHTA